MTHAVVVSPHLDDAVLSCGRMLAAYPGCVVASVFTATPARRLTCTAYDRDSGFPNAAAAMACRRQEDTRALRHVGATGHHLGFLDHQYDADRPDIDTLADAIASVVREQEPETLVCPLGLGHPDHRLVAAACRRVSAPDRLVYEDLPYRVLIPEQVPDALAEWRTVGDLELWNVVAGPADMKEQAVSVYASQLWALDMHAVRCPERFWRVTA